MYKLGRFAVAVGLAITSAAFPAMAQQAQQQMPMQQGGQQTPDDHSAHHGGTDQQTGQPSPGGGMTGGMKGEGMQGMMGGGQQEMMGSGMQGMHGGMMGQGGPGMMNQGMMGGCPMMEGMMGSGMGMHGGMVGQDGPGMMQGRKGAMFGSRVTPMMNLSPEDVRGYLTAQVDLLNNKRLKVGDIKADDGTITADIVTVDNSLVQRLKVDRHTGIIEYQK